MHRALAYVLALLGVVACSPLQRQAESLAGSQGCCREVAEFKFDEIEPAKASEVNINEASPAYAFPEGKSYFAAFRLPVSGTARRLLLKTHRTGLLVPDSQIFCPVVTFLDERLQPLFTTSDLPLSYEPPGWVTNGFWYSVVEMPPIARHFVIHTAAKSIGRPITLSAPSSGYSFFTGKSYVYVPGGPSTQRFPCGQMGRIEVEVR